MRKPLVAGNWKMHGISASVVRLIEGIKYGVTPCGDIEIAVCPPFVYLPQVAHLLAGTSVMLGAQNVCSETGPGAYTGEVSATMLSDIHCKYVIVGHSERRNLYGETNEITAKKACAADSSGLTPIFCVGELLVERERNETETVISRQLDALLKQKCIDKLLNHIVIAYEPVWAIGTGRNATPTQAQSVHAFIRQYVGCHNAEAAMQLRIIYGGSVKPDNASKLFAMPDIDGGLIGGASLETEQFLEICRALS